MCSFFYFFLKLAIDFWKLEEVWNMEIVQANGMEQISHVLDEVLKTREPNPASICYVPI